MDAMISINPPYTRMIFGGTKPMEFRKKVLNDMLKEDPEMDVYIYETKNHGGYGKVIGKTKIENVYKVFYENEPEETNHTLVQERFHCVKDLYYIWCEKLRKRPNYKEGWFKDTCFKKYKKSIGWGYPQNFNYAILFSNITLFEEPKDLDEFVGSKGEILKRPPQNMCFCKLM